MADASAFAVNAPIRRVGLGGGGTWLTTQRKPRTNAAPPPAVLRRLAVLCDIGRPSTGADAEGMGAAKKPDDSTASDLALPNLRDLFEAVGDPDCEQCGGAGWITCAVCDGKGFFTLTMMDTVSSTQCRMCRGQGKIPCPSCRAEVYDSVLWWDLIPSKEDDPEEKWRDGDEDGNPRISWGGNPALPGS